MAIPEQQNSSSLAKAYNHILSRVKDSIDNADAQAAPSLQRAMELAKKEAIRLGEVTLEEAEEVSSYIKHDINEAAEYLMETSHEFSEWLLMDIEIIEHKVLELFLSVADRTQIELEQFSHPGCELTKPDSREYHSGEYTDPMELICTQCGQQIKLDKTTKIPICCHCQGNSFKRLQRK